MKAENVIEYVEYCRKFRDPIAECERKISEMARMCVKSEREFDKNWYDNRMREYVEAYYILRKNE